MDSNTLTLADVDVQAAAPSTIEYLSSEVISIISLGVPLCLVSVLPTLRQTNYLPTLALS